MSNIESMQQATEKIDQKFIDQAKELTEKNIAEKTNDLYFKKLAMNPSEKEEHITNLARNLAKEKTPTYHKA